MQTTAWEPAYLPLGGAIPAWPAVAALGPALFQEARRLQQQVHALQQWKQKALADLAALRLENRRLQAELQQQRGGAPQAQPSAAEDPPEVPTSSLLSFSVEPPPGLAEAAGAAPAPELASGSLPPFPLDPPPGLLPGAAAAAPGEGPASALMLPFSIEPPPGLAEGAAPAPEVASGSPAPAPLDPPSGLLPLDRAATVPAHVGSTREGITVQAATVDGRPCWRAEWRIGAFKKKLKSGMGRPLVSSPFELEAFGVAGLRLMICPEVKGLEAGAPGKKQFSDLVNNGPLQCALKLKAMGPGPQMVLTFYLTAGSERRGPFAYDFSESVVQGCSDFGMDWLKQVQSSDGELSVGVEVVESREGL